MSYSADEYHGPDTVTCPGCGAEKHGDYKLRKCSHPGCENLGCACLGTCGAGTHEGVYCDDHRIRVRLAPGLMVESCIECRDAIEIGEILEFAGEEPA